MRLRRVAAWCTAVLAFGLGAAVASSAMALGPQAQPSSSFLSDTFDRTTSHGWGTASSGQSWASTPAGRTSTSGGTGHVALAPGSNVTITEPSVLSGDARIAISVTPAALPTAGNGVYTSLALRSKNGHAYRATLRFGRAGQLSLNLTRADGGSAQTTLVADRLLRAAAVRGGTYRLEFQALGSGSVRLQARAWLVGAERPDWQVAATDTSRQRLSAPAAVGVRAYLSSGTPAVAVAFDDALVQPVDATTGEPTLPPSAASQGPSQAPGTSTPSTSAAAPPAATAVGTPSPTATIVPAPTAPSGGVATSGTVGSLPVGSARYPVPQGAIFASAGPVGSGAGTLSSPYGSAQAAVDAAPSGSTIVLRGGYYHESLLIPQGKALTVQAYPGEAVWFDGSSRVTGWAASGGTWSVSGWDHVFSHAVSYIQGQDESARFVDPAFPMAGYPDQVWLDDVALRQVGSASAVAPGTFYVDTLGQRLVIGSDPTGHRVDASTLVKGIQIQGAGSTVRGLGVRRYADHLSAFGAISAEMPNVTLENVVVTENATVGIFAWASGHTLNHVSATANGLLGLSANTVDHMTVKSSAFTGNNTEHFKTEPSSGGIKISRSAGVTVTDSTISSNTTNGLWFDVYSSDITIARNTFAGNGSDGLVVELSNRAVVAGNHFVRNGRAGLDIMDSGDVAVWNDTMVGNGQFAIRMMQDGRVGTDPTFPVTLRSIQVRNSVLAIAATSACPILVQDTTQTRSAADMALTFDTNLYQRTSATTPSNIACLANGANPFATFKTLDALRSGTGGDAGSAMLEGAAAVEPNDLLTAAARGLVTPAAVPTDVAAALGVAPGWKGTVGATAPTLG